MTQNLKGVINKISFKEPINKFVKWKKKIPYS